MVEDLSVIIIYILAFLKKTDNYIYIAYNN